MTFTKKVINSPEKEQILQDFRQHISSGKAAFFEKYQMQFIAGDRSGCYLEDMDQQKKLFNLHCNGGTFNLGHRNPDIIAALNEAMKSLDIGNHHFISQARTHLALKLAKTMPQGLDQVVFGVSGGEAVDVAIKLARGYRGKQKIISAYGGYHGHTGLSIQTGDEKYLTPFHLNKHHFEQIPFNDIEALEKAIDSDTAAVILETIPATHGMILPSPDYLKKVQAICEKNQVLLILDEVQTGWGRTGKLWGFEHFDVAPDIVVLAKGMSGGIYPISATVFHEKLKFIFDQHPFSHISTFGGSELGCMVASKVLQMSQDPDFLNHVNSLAEKFREQLQGIRQRPMIGFQQLGLMMAIETESDMTGPLLTKTAYDEGLLMIYANNRPSAVQFLPPLIMSEKDIEDVIFRLTRALKQAKRLLPLLKMKSWIGL